MVKLVNALVSKANEEILEGSNPSVATYMKGKNHKSLTVSEARGYIAGLDPVQFSVFMDNAGMLALGGDPSGVSICNALARVFAGCPREKCDPTESEDVVVIGSAIRDIVYHATAKESRKTSKIITTNSLSSQVGVA